MKRPWGGAVLVVVGVLFFVLLPGLLFFGPKLAFRIGGHPTDRQLIKRFREHRAELDQLVEMFQTDAKLGRVGENFTRPPDPERIGISPERVQEYRRLCATVGSVLCIEGYAEDADGNASVDGEKNPIWIHVSTEGLSIAGEGKGFLYSKAPKFDIVPDLDDDLPLPPGRKSQTWIRRIDGPWYLYLDVRN